MPHKGARTFGYRVSDSRSVLAYITDHCPTALGPGLDGLGCYHASGLALASGADVLVHDAQLLAEEVPAEAAFGHACAEYAVRLAFLGRPDRPEFRAPFRHVVPARQTNRCAIIKPEHQQHHKTKPGCHLLLAQCVSLAYSYTSQSDDDTAVPVLSRRISLVRAVGAFNGSDPGSPSSLADGTISALANLGHSIIQFGRC
jgi:hypothetical protein